jgi:hypothetical protein
MVVRLSALGAGSALLPKNISVRGSVKPQAIMRPEGLGKVKKKMQWRIEISTQIPTVLRIVIVVQKINH